jgi:hypothetical protein
VATTGGAGLVMADGPNPDNETYTVTLKPGAGVWKSLGLEVDTDAALPGADISRGGDRFVITEINAAVSLNGRDAATKTPFVLAYSTVSPTVGFPAMAVLDGNPKTGFGIVGRAKAPFLILRFAQPLHTTAESALTVQVHQDSAYRQATIGRFRVAFSSGNYSWENNFKPKPPKKEVDPDSKEDSKEPDTTVVVAGLPRSLTRALERPEAKRSADQNETIRDYFEYSAPQLFQERLALAKLETDQSYLKGAVAEVMVTESVEPRETRLLPRGNWMDDSGDIEQLAIP